MTHTRRDFLSRAAASIAAAPLLAIDPALRVAPMAARQPRRRFLHGVASGDPRQRGVLLWTRVSGAAPRDEPEVAWEIARDDRFRRVTARGVTSTGRYRDFTVKVDVSGLAPGTTYYYRFQAGGERSPAGRTRTLPSGEVPRVRLALASCANLPAGYFNVYARIAARHDLDAVVHLGDYIYEYANRGYGDGSRFGRIPSPDRETVTLDDYRTRQAQYKTDPDLQEAHRQHPWIAVWDDHEVANNTWREGAQNHQDVEGDWRARRDAAVQAYYEWMPIREDQATRQVRIYRSFAFGSLADLVMLDTRVTDRDQEAPRREQVDIIEDPRRSLLGAGQEQWLFRELAESKRQGVRWQVLGQQVMFAPMAPWGRPAANKDAWDGYRPARNRVIDFLAAQNISDAVVLTGDVHSSWAYDIARDPWRSYDASSGRGAVAVEIVTPSVTSPSGWGDAPRAEERRRALLAERPHLRWADGMSRGYVVLDLTPHAVQADWYFVPTVEERNGTERFAKGFRSAAGQPHLIEVASPLPAARSAPPAP